MPFVLGNGSGKLAIHLKLASDPDDMVITMGVRAPAAPSPAELTWIYDSFADNWAGNLSNEYTIRAIEVVGKTSGGADYQVELLGNQAGGAAGTFLPQNVALLVKKSTGLPGRKNRGRMYIPGTLQASQVAENGVVAAGDLGAFQTQASAFLADLTTDANTGITDAAVLHPDGTFTLITALVVDDVVATQRRRLR